MNWTKTTFSAVATLFLLMAACGGSGSDGDGGPNGGGASGSATHLFYRSGSISRIDPDNPSAAPVLIEAGATAGERGLWHATVDNAKGQLTDWHTRAIVYANKDDGKLYKISTLKRDSQTPAQVSNETGASIVCDSDWEADLSDHGRSVYLYELPGGDDDCFFADDNVWKMVRMGMAAADTPIIAKEVVIGFFNSATEAITGFLAIDGQEIVRCDQDFQNCSPVVAFTNEGKRLRGSILQVDGKLYHYNANTATLSSALHTFSGGTPASIPIAADDFDLYFADGATLLKLPRNGSFPASPLITESGPIDAVSLTTSRVAYLVGKSTLKSIHKLGGTGTILAPSGVSSIAETTGNLVYYNKHSSIFMSSGVIRDDGTGGIELPNSLWRGWTVSSTQTSTTFTLQKVIRVENCPSQFTCAGATLKSYDAATHGGEIVLGALPSDVFDFFFSGFEDKILGWGLATGSRADIFFANVNQANSLKRITNTPIIDEFRIVS